VQQQEKNSVIREIRAKKIPLQPKLLIFL